MVIFGPLVSLAMLAPSCMGPGSHATVISPTYRSQLAPLMEPLWLVAIAWVGCVRILVSEATAKPRRVAALRAALWLGFATSWCSEIFSLAGASPAWGWLGYIFGVVTVVLLPLSRYAHDVSDEIQPGFLS